MNGGDTFVLSDTNKLESGSILLDSDNGAYYQYSGDVEITASGDTTITFVSGSTSPTGNQIEGLDHDNASTVWTRVGNQIYVDYLKYPEIPTTTYDGSTYTDDEELDPDIPLEHQSILPILACALTLKQSMSADERALSRSFMETWSEELADIQEMENNLGDNVQILVRP